MTPFVAGQSLVRSQGFDLYLVEALGSMPKIPSLVQMLKGLDLIFRDKSIMELRIRREDLGITEEYEDLLLPLLSSGHKELTNGYSFNVYMTPDGAFFVVFKEPDGHAAIYLPCSKLDPVLVELKKLGP